MVRIAFIADDFTGATDSLWQFSRHGLTTRLLTVHSRVDARELDGVDVVGIATTARSLPSDRIPELVLPLVRAVLELGVRVVQYKVCSTFDSSPRVGSIGRVIDAILESGLVDERVIVAPAQPELGRYTAFGNHFARYQGEVHRLDRHEPMATHAVTPVDEADLRLHLQRQTTRPICSIPTSTMSEDELGTVWDGTSSIAVADAMTDSDLQRLARLIKKRSVERPLLVVGSGGISQALAATEPDATPARGYSPAAPADGPVLAVAGSRSPGSARQLAIAEGQGWTSIDLLATPLAEATASALQSLRAGRDTVVYSARGALSSGPVPADLGQQLAGIVEAGIREGGVRRAIVIGGDTSGAVVETLGANALELALSFDVGSPVCRVVSSDPVLSGIELVLKGGQVGVDNFYNVASGRPGVEPA